MLNHPNIIKLYELFEDDKRFYLIMEKVDGNELYEELADKDTFCEEDAAGLLK